MRGVEGATMLKNKVLWTAISLAGFLAVANGSARATPPSSRDNTAEVADKKSRTGIEWKVQPAHVVIYVDGKKVGEAGSLTFTETKPGKHAVRLTKGGDETEMEVKVNKGEVVTFEFEFTDG